METRSDRGKTDWGMEDGIGAPNSGRGLMIQISSKAVVADQ